MTDHDNTTLSDMACKPSQKKTFLSFRMMSFGIFMRDKNNLCEMAFGLTANRLLGTVHLVPVSQHGGQTLAAVPSESQAAVPCLWSSSLATLMLTNQSCSFNFFIHFPLSLDAHVHWIHNVIKTSIRKWTECCVLLLCQAVDARCKSILLLNKLNPNSWGDKTV